MREADIIESFALLCMAPSEIDRSLHLGDGMARSVISNWWYACKVGEDDSNAITRWTSQIWDLYNSCDRSRVVMRHGKTPTDAHMLLLAALAYVPKEVRDMVRIGDGVIEVKS